VDRGTLGLYFSDAPARSHPSDLLIEAGGEVPAGETAKRFRAEVRLSADTHVLALRPDLQPGVTSIEVAARKPDGGTEVLLFADHIPLDWPTPYILKTPVGLPRSSVLSVTAYYANTGASARPGGFRLTVSKH